MERVVAWDVVVVGGQLKIGAERRHNLLLAGVFQVNDRRAGRSLLIDANRHRVRRPGCLRA